VRSGKGHTTTKALFEILKNYQKKPVFGCLKMVRRSLGLFESDFCNKAIVVVIVVVVVIT